MERLPQTCVRGWHLPPALRALRSDQTVGTRVHRAFDRLCYSSPFRGRVRKRSALFDGVPDTRVPTDRRHFVGERIPASSARALIVDDTDDEGRLHGYERYTWS